MSARARGLGWEEIQANRLPCRTVTEYRERYKRLLPLQQGIDNVIGVSAVGRDVATFDITGTSEYMSESTTEWTSDDDQILRIRRTAVVVGNVYSNCIFLTRPSTIARNDITI